MINIIAIVLVGLCVAVLQLSPKALAALGDIATWAMLGLLLAAVLVAGEMLLEHVRQGQAVDNDEDEHRGNSV